MKNALRLTIVLLLLAVKGVTQQFSFEKGIAADSASRHHYMEGLSGNLLNDRAYLIDSNDLFRIQLLAGRYKEAISTIQSVRARMRGLLPFIQYELYAQAAQNASFSSLFNNLFKSLNDKDAIYLATAFLSRFGIDDLHLRYMQTLQNFTNRDSINLQEAISLCRNYNLWQVYRIIEPKAQQLLKDDDERRYIIQDSVLIKTPEGITLSAMVVRKRS